MIKKIINSFKEWYYKDINLAIEKRIDFIKDITEIQKTCIECIYNDYYDLTQHHNFYINGHKLSIPLENSTKTIKRYEELTLQEKYIWLKLVRTIQFYIESVNYTKKELIELAYNVYWNNKGYNKYTKYNDLSRQDFEEWSKLTNNAFKILSKC